MLKASQTSLFIRPHRVTHGGRVLIFTTAKDADIFCQELDREDGATSTWAALRLDQVPLSGPEEGGGTPCLMLEPVEGPGLAHSAAID